jgi:hypothetical protein
VSSAAPPIDPRAPNGSDAEQARAQQELANAIEAETVVLRQRIVELTAMVERMQEEVRAQGLAQRAAEEAAKTAPIAKAAPWSEQSWPLLSAIVALPLLLAAALAWRRRQRRERPAQRPTTGAAAIPSAPAATPPDTGLQNIAAGMAAAPTPKVEPPPPGRGPRRTPMARNSPRALAVSELLQVTEEARVYVALGHPERAIDVLNEHVRQVPRSMPAAWLMLLGLYHTSGRRQEFRRLAEEFHLHCNVQAPLWEGFGSSDEGGLETFPHILRQVSSIWRQPGCREYLEGLLYDNRQGRRVGFPLAAYGEVLLLLQILDAPPPVDIDSDLVNDGRLEPIRQRLAAAANASPARPAVSSSEPRARSADAAQHPAQRPLELEPDLDEAVPDRARRSSS